MTDTPYSPYPDTVLSELAFVMGVVYNGGSKRVPRGAIPSYLRVTANQLHDAGDAEASSRLRAAVEHFVQSNDTIALVTTIASICGGAVTKIEADDKSWKG